MIYRGVSEAFDIALQPYLKNNSSDFEIAIDIIVLSNLYTEIIPSLLISFILWKSYKEIKHLKESNSTKSPNSQNGNREYLLSSIKGKEINPSLFNDNRYSQISKDMPKHIELIENDESYIFAVTSLCNLFFYSIKISINI